jgi:hypothetical protein
MEISYNQAVTDDSPNRPSPGPAPTPTPIPRQPITDESPELRIHGGILDLDNERAVIAPRLLSS